MYGTTALIVSVLEYFMWILLYSGCSAKTLFQFQFCSVKFTFKGNFKDKMGVMQSLLSYKGCNRGVFSALEFYMHL